MNITGSFFHLAKRCFLLSDFDCALGKVPDLHCFKRCTVAARTLARLPRRCYPTRDAAAIMSHRLFLRTRDPLGPAGTSAQKFRRDSQPWQDPTACATTYPGQGWETGPDLRIPLF